MKSSICLLAVSWVCIISASAQDCVGPGILPPGYCTTISDGVVFVGDVPQPCPSLDMLREAVDDACDAILTSTDELDRQELSISVTPNPTNDLVPIAAGALISSITITSLAGQEVRSLSELHSREVVVSLSDMPVGMYTLTIVQIPALVV